MSNPATAPAEDVSSYFAGVGIAVVSTMCSAIGLVCQKLTHKRIVLEAAAAAAAAATEPSDINSDGGPLTQASPASSVGASTVAGSPAGATASLPSQTVLSVSRSDSPEGATTPFAGPSATPSSHGSASASSPAASTPSSATTKGAASKSPPSSYFCRPLWLLGITCMIGGALLSFAVFNFLGQSRASAMASMTIVWSGILSALVLGERFTLWDLLVTTIIIGGASVAVVFGSVGSAAQSNSDMGTVVALLSRSVVLAGGLAIACAWLAVFAWVRYVASFKELRSPASIRLECFCRIFLSGIMTGVTGMCSSSVVKGISGAIRDGDASEVLASYQFWLLLVSLPLSLVLQLGYLNSALAQMDALEIVPPYQAAVIVIGLLWGWLFTGDAQGSTSLSLAMFATGCSISVVGVALLALKPRMVVAIDAFLLAKGCCLCFLRGAPIPTLGAAHSGVAPPAEAKPAFISAAAADCETPTSPLLEEDRSAQHSSLAATQAGGSPRRPSGFAMRLDT